MEHAKTPIKRPRKLLRPRFEQISTRLCRLPHSANPCHYCLLPGCRPADLSQTIYRGRSGRAASALPASSGQHLPSWRQCNHGAKTVQPAHGHFWLIFHPSQAVNSYARLTGHFIKEDLNSLGKRGPFSPRPSFGPIESMGLRLKNEKEPIKSRVLTGLRLYTPEEGPPSKTESQFGHF